MNRHSVSNRRFFSSALSQSETVSLEAEHRPTFVPVFFQAGLIALFCTLLIPPCILRAAPQPSEPLSTTISRTIQDLSRDKSPAIVRIRSVDEHGEIAGTGFYIDPTGTICTLVQIVQGSHDIMIEQQGKSFPATLLASDFRSGVAFLRATKSKASDSFLPPLQTTNSPAMTPVIGIGYPREQQASTVLGLITGSKNHEGENYFCVTHLTASLPLSEGEGGSPILDLDGNLLGMVITGNTQLGVCTILPSAAIEKLHHNLLRYGSLSPGWVGAVVEVAAVPEQNSRTRVVSVEPGSPAETAGIRSGDRLIAMDNHPIDTPEDILDPSFYLSAGDNLHLVISRDGVTNSITLQCAERPTPQGEELAGQSTTPLSVFGSAGH